MIWRNYYRPKQHDPYSVAALERLDKKELLKRKKYYEKTIKLIENFDQKKYQNNIPYKEILKKNEEIKKKFLRIKNHIKIDTKYYAQRSLFGSLKNGKILCNITCDLNSQTKSFLSDFEDYSYFICKFLKISKKNEEYNIQIAKFINNQKFKDNIKAIDKIYNMNSQNLDYVGYDLLDNVDTGLFDTNGTSINLRHHYVQLRKNIENPLKSNDSYWLKSFECTLEEFSKIDSVNSYLNEVKDQRYADKSINICGAFFKEIDRISKINNFYYLVLPYSEEFIAELKQKLLKFYNAYLRKIILINRSEKRNESLEKNFNNVYVLSNKSYEGIYKIGWTTNLAEERADQLSSETGVLYPFKVVFSKEFKNAEKIEKKIHTKFRKFRLRGNKEFFEIEKEKLIDFISNIED